MLIEPTETETKASLDHFIAVMREIAEKTAAGDVEEMKQNPVSAPRKKLDEVRAAKNPVLKYTASEAA